MIRTTCYGCPALNGDGTCTNKFYGRTITFRPKMDEGCHSAPEDHEKKKTNGDRVRELSDEEFAIWLCDRHACPRCPGEPLCKFGEGRANGLIKWLKKPYRGDKSNG